MEASVLSEPRVFFDIDTQVDFMLPHGKLYVPGAEGIIPNLVRLMTCARENAFPVISSADAHAPDDPEFAVWPPHCIAGTPGQQRIPETQFANPAVVPCRAGAFTALTPWPGQTILEKQTYDTADNPNFDAVLEALGGRRSVVFGVATEYCVRASALALRRRGWAVDLVVDGIKAITAEGGRKGLEEMTQAGVRFVTTMEVCGNETR
jgi:nicotinamidase/pyrazinamidase